MLKRWWKSFAKWFDDWFFSCEDSTFGIFKEITKVSLIILVAGTIIGAFVFTPFIIYDKYSDHITEGTVHGKEYSPASVKPQKSEEWFVIIEGPKNGKMVHERIKVSRYVFDTLRIGDHIKKDYIKE